jgi:hypothetical protein
MQRKPLKDPGCTTALQELNSSPTEKGWESVEEVGDF